MTLQVNTNSQLLTMKNLEQVAQDVTLISNLSSMYISCCYCCLYSSLLFEIVLLDTLRKIISKPKWKMITISERSIQIQNSNSNFIFKMSKVKLNEDATSTYKRMKNHV